MAWLERKKAREGLGSVEPCVAPPHQDKDGVEFDYSLHAIRPDDLVAWGRPARPDPVPTPSDEQPFLFQLTECRSSYVRPKDMGIGKSFFDWSWSKNEQVPVIRAYGVIPTGQSVCVNVWNFAPYLFLDAPPGASASQVKRALNKHLIAATYRPNKGKGGGGEGDGPIIDGIPPLFRQFAARKPSFLSDDSQGGLFGLGGSEDSVTRELRRRDSALLRASRGGDSRSGLSEKDLLRESGISSIRPNDEQARDSFFPDGGDDEEKDLVQDVEEVYYKLADTFLFEPRRLFKVSLRTPNLVTKVRTLIDETGLRLGRDVVIRGPTYESSVKFENRFMIDTNCTGSGWVRLAQGGRWAVRPEHKHQSTCTLEIDADWSAFRGISTEEDPALYEKPSRMRILSYDIECVPLSGGFPNPKSDPVININFHVCEIDRPTEIIADIGLVLGSVPVDMGRDGAQRIFCFENERDLINEFGRFRILFDPDIETQYNGKNFDEPYLHDRAVFLNCKMYLQSTRNTKEEIYKRSDKKSSKQTGDRDSWLTPCEGRVSIDMILFIKANHKLRSYSLNAVAEKFLGMRKDDVSHTIIPTLWRGRPEDRARLYSYCRKDALLPLLMVFKLMVIQSTFELCRYQGVQLFQQQESGATLKTFVAFLRAFRAEGYVLPYRPDLFKPDYEGATVLEPRRGFYDYPIATLDFSSLYPSQFVAHNICMSTYVHPNHVEDVMEKLGGESALERCPNGHYYVRSHIRQGIIPKLLSKGLAARSVVKKQAAACKDPFLKGVYTSRELAIKLFNNSVYGYTGRVANGMCLWQLADSTTAYGRDQLRVTGKGLRSKFTKANGYPADIIIIYGDTDSVLIDFGIRIVNQEDKAEVKEKIETTIKLAKEAGAHCTTFFAKPNSLEFENVYLPLLMMNKKRYVGLFWQNGDKYSYMKERGIESVRRDSCPYLSSTMKQCMDILLNKRDAQKALDAAKQRLIRLREGFVGIEELLLGAQLKDMKSYKTTVAHAVVAKKMEARNPGNGPKAGDRVPYVIVVTSDKKAKRYEKAEDPLFVLENDLPIDYTYYVEHQMLEPLTRLFKTIFGVEKTQLALSLKNIKLHIKQSRVAVGGGGPGLGAFFKPIQTCLSCGVASQGCKGVLCQHCQGELIPIYAREQGKYSQLELEYNRLWTQCQNCQGSFFKDVDKSCSAYDCPIFYKRQQVKKDFVEQGKRMTLFRDTPSW